MRPNSSKPYFRARSRQSCAAGLSRRSERLGDLNDIVTHEDLMADIARSPSPNARARDRSRRAFAAGVLMGHEDARLDSVLAEAVAACGTFAKAKPFWKWRMPERKEFRRGNLKSTLFVPTLGAVDRRIRSASAYVLG
jgi:hypothetical protein